MLGVGSAQSIYIETGPLEEPGSHIPGSSNYGTFLWMTKTCCIDSKVKRPLVTRSNASLRVFAFSLLRRLAELAKGTAAPPTPLLSVPTGTTEQELDVECGPKQQGFGFVRSTPRRATVEADSSSFDSATGTG